jgi:hypothetical protein
LLSKEVKTETEELQIEREYQGELVIYILSEEDILKKQTHV